VREGCKWESHNESSNVSLSCGLFSVCRRHRLHCKTGEYDVTRASDFNKFSFAQPEFSPPEKPEADIYFFETFSSEDEFDAKCVHLTMYRILGT